MIGLLLAIVAARLPSLFSQPAPPRLVIAVVGSNEGTELTDFLIPRAILAEAGAANVVTVSPNATKIRMLATSLTVDPDLTIAAFDSANPRGANYVIVPAIEPSPAIVKWLRQQASLGATIVAICDGAWTVASTGLLEKRKAAGHWASLSELRKKYPGTTWVPDRRYVIDGRFISTTGVSAAIPASLMLVERIAGRAAAEKIARRIAVSGWGPAHESRAFSRDKMPYPMRAFMDSLTRWRRDTVAVRLGDGVDEVALGLTLDAVSRRAAVVTVSDGASVVTGRQGLRFSVDRGRSDRISVARELRLPAASAPPANALEVALTKLEAWFGREAAELVALQMEYQRRGSR